MADEDAYLEKGIKARFRIDPSALPTLAAASLIFDEFTSHPIMGLGLKPIVGFNFLELFGSTIKKLGDSGLVHFDLEARVPHESRDKLHRITEFLKEVQNTEKALYRRVNMSLQDPFADTQEHDLVYGRITKLPIVAPISRLASPIGQTIPELRDQKRRFEILREVLAIEVPNFEVKTLDDVLEIRRAYGAQEFRKVFRMFYHNLGDSGVENYTTISAGVAQHWNRLKNEAIDLLTKEFKSEIRGWGTITAGISVLLDLAGFIPVVSTLTSGVSVAKDAKELVDQLSRRHRAKEFGWLCFLTDLRERQRP